MATNKILFFSLKFSVLHMPLDEKSHLVYDTPMFFTKKGALP